MINGGNEIMLEYKEIQLLVALENRKGFKELNSCFDYVDSIRKDDKTWMVSVFIEPVGKLTVRGPDLENILAFWLHLFQTQPHDWDYAKSGWHLENYLESFTWKHPGEAKDIWSKRSN
jgi:hypothetical protein